MEHLQKIRPDTSVLTVVILPEEEPDKFVQEEHKDKADYLVLTDLEKLL